MTEEKILGLIPWEKKKELLPFADSQFIATATRYTEMMNLPKEAVSAVLVTAQAANGLNKLIRKQMKLTSVQRKALVQSKDVIGDIQLKDIDEFVQANKMPYNVLYISQDKKVAIRAQGWNYKLQTDPRIMKCWEPDPIVAEMTTLPDGNIMFTAKATLVFWNGQRFPETGTSDIAEIQSRRPNTPAPPSFAAMISVTRAKARCIRAAIALPYDIAEDVQDVENAKGNPVIEVKATPVTNAPTNKAQLIARAMGDFKLSMKDMIALLGKKSIDEVMDFPEAWRVIEKAMKKPEEK